MDEEWVQIRRLSKGKVLISGACFEPLTAIRETRLSHEIAKSGRRLSQALELIILPASST